MRVWTGNHKRCPYVAMHTPDTSIQCSERLKEELGLVAWVDDDERK